MAVSSNQKCKHRQQLGQKKVQGILKCGQIHTKSIFVLIPDSSVSLPPRHQHAIGTLPLELCTAAEEQMYLGCLLRHHYMSVWHHLFSVEETMPGQDQQFEQTIHQVGAGGRGGIRNRSKRSTKLKWMEG